MPFHTNKRRSHSRAERPRAWMCRIVANNLESRWHNLRYFQLYQLNLDHTSKVAAVRKLARRLRLCATVSMRRTASWHGFRLWAAHIADRGPRSGGLHSPPAAEAYCEGAEAKLHASPSRHLRRRLPWRATQ
jgi:hypothetical protein